MEKELLQSKHHLLHPLLRSIRKVSRKLLLQLSIKWYRDSYSCIMLFWIALPMASNSTLIPIMLQQLWERQAAGLLLDTSNMYKHHCPLSGQALDCSNSWIGHALGPPRSQIPLPIAQCQAGPKRGTIGHALHVFHFCMEPLQCVGTSTSIIIGTPLLPLPLPSWPPMLMMKKMMIATPTSAAAAGSSRHHPTTSPLLQVLTSSTSFAGQVHVHSPASTTFSLSLLAISQHQHHLLCEDVNDRCRGAEVTEHYHHHSSALSIASTHNSQHQHQHHHCSIMIHLLLLLLGWCQMPAQATTGAAEDEWSWAETNDDDDDDVLEVQVLVQGELRTVDDPLIC